MSAQNSVDWVRKLENLHIVRCKRVDFEGMFYFDAKYGHLSFN